METKQPIGTWITSMVRWPHGGYSITYGPHQRRQALITIAAAQERGEITRGQCEDLVADVLANTWNCLG